MVEVLFCMTDAYSLYDDFVVQDIRMDAFFVCLLPSWAVFEACSFAIHRLGGYDVDRIIYIYIMQYIYTYDVNVHISTSLRLRRGSRTASWASSPCP